MLEFVIEYFDSGFGSVNLNRETEKKTNVNRAKRPKYPASRYFYVSFIWKLSLPSTVFLVDSKIVGKKNTQHCLNWLQCSKVIEE